MWPESVSNLWGKISDNVASMDANSAGRKAAQIGWNVFGVIGFLSVTTYAVPNLIHKVRRVQNLKRKYASSWAAVSGGSSGIGRALVEKLASQGINVVVIAYPDELLHKAVDEYRTKYPQVSFRKVGANLAEDNFMTDVKAACDDIPVSVVMMNAGYIKLGFFTSVSCESQLANHHCNATSVVRLTHYFVSEMERKKLKGCVTFTSSPAAFLPCPFSCMYGATKAWLTEFATSLAPEIASEGIDVCVVHPSPVESRFYSGAPSLQALAFFKSTSIGPERIADSLFASVGRTVVRDQGYYPIMMRMLLKVVDLTFLCDVMAGTAHHLGDYKAMKAQNNKVKR